MIYPCISKEECVLPVMTDGAETLTLELVAQRSVERAMIGLRDRLPYKKMGRCEVLYAITRIKSFKRH